MVDGPNTYGFCKGDPVNGRDPMGLWDERGLIEAFEQEYGDDMNAMLALFTVLTYYKLEQGDFYLNAWAPPDHENGIIQIAANQGLGWERSNENAAGKLYEILYEHFPQFGLKRSWGRAAWDVPVGSTKTILGTTGAVGLGGIAIVDPEPLTKVAAGGGAVVSGAWAVEGVTQVFGAGPVGGWNPIQEAAGWYGRTVGGDEGEVLARGSATVAQLAFALAGSLSQTNLGNYRFTKFRQIPLEVGRSLAGTYREGGKALMHAFERFKIRYLEGKNLASIAARWRAASNFKPGGVVAVAKGYINNKPLDELISNSGKSLSGTVGLPSKTRFSFKTVGFTREFDAERKLLETLAGRLAPDSRGVIHLFVELTPCKSCAGVIEEFKALFPGIKVVITVK